MGTYKLRELYAQKVAGELNVNAAPCPLGCIPLEAIRDLYKSNDSMADGIWIEVSDPDNTSKFLNRAASPVGIVFISFCRTEVIVRVKGQKTDRIMEKWSALIKEKLAMPWSAKNISFKLIWQEVTKHGFDSD